MANKRIRAYGMRKVSLSPKPPQENQTSKLHDSVTPILRDIYKKLVCIGLQTRRLGRRAQKKICGKLPGGLFRQRLLPWALAVPETCKAAWLSLKSDPKAYARCCLLSLAYGISLKEAAAASKKEFSAKRKVFLGRAVSAGVWAVAACSLVGAYHLASSYEMSVKVLLDGAVVCYTDDQAKVLLACDAIAQEVSDTTGQPYALRAVPDYRLALVPNDSVASEPALKTKLLKAVEGEVAPASALMVDGKIIGVNEDKLGMQKILSDILAPYRSDNPDETVEFVNDVEVRSGLLPVCETKTLFDLRAYLTRPAVKDATYVVQENDMVSAIAQKVGSSTQQLLKLNPDVVPERLRTGDQLLVQQAKPLLSVKVITEIEYEQPIPYETKKIETNTLYRNASQVKTQGRAGEELIRAEVCKIDGVEVDRTIVETRVLQAPVSKEVLVGTKALPKTAPTGNFRRPVSGSISSRFGYRWGRELHTGIDISVPTGTAIRAADGGKVTFAGWSGNYGYIVKLSHGNGVETWYAHNSKLLVSKGDSVYKGQTIAKSGSTGRSTGPHCHFEYRVNGVPKNPAKYISF